MCEFCIVGSEEEPCNCVCSTFMGKKVCEKCGHRIRNLNSPR